jgi:cation:H+ antiporter
MTLLPLAAILGGLVVLIWSADRFVLGAAALAARVGMTPLLIGMLVVGFGTSAPELIVSVLAAWQGAPGIALGNAYGSNIVNIALILGVTALVTPICIKSGVVRRELPALLGVTALTIVLLWDLTLSQVDALVLLAVFALFVAWSIREAGRAPGDALGVETAAEAAAHPLSRNAALAWTLGGLVLLVLSSRALVWGAVEVAQVFGVSDLVIGLTVVAVGTSLPEFASSLAAVRRGEDDIAIGNVVGSNIFNTLAVVGLAGLFGPIAAPPEILTRDLPVMAALSVALVVICVGFGRQGRINRLEGATLLAVFLGYTGYLVSSFVGTAAASGAG